jgi:hypothetical protein
MKTTLGETTKPSHPKCLACKAAMASSDRTGVYIGCIIDQVPEVCGGAYNVYDVCRMMALASQSSNAEVKHER